MNENTTLEASVCTHRLSKRSYVQSGAYGMAEQQDLTPELLKYAEAPISQALHDLFSTVWSFGKVPAEWKEGITVSLNKG